MLSLIRDAFNATRDGYGKCGVVAHVVIFVVAAPCILVFFILGIVIWPLEMIGAWANKSLRGIGKRLDDPVFGPVIYQGYGIWHAELTLEALGGRLVVAVPGTHAAGPNPAYADLLRELAERQHDIARQAEQSIFGEYQALAPEMRRQYAVGSDWLSEEFRKSVPILEDPAQIWTLLSGGTITLDDEAEQPGCFSISWECTWGIEYGDVYRTFVNWKLEEEEAG